MKNILFLASLLFFCQQHSAALAGDLYYDPSYDPAPGTKSSIGPLSMGPEKDGFVTILGAGPNGTVRIQSVHARDDAATYLPLEDAVDAVNPQELQKVTVGPDVSVFYHVGPNINEDVVAHSSKQLPDGSRFLEFTNLDFQNQGIASSIAHYSILASPQEFSPEIAGDFKTGEDICLRKDLGKKKAGSDAELKHIFANGKAQIAFGGKIFGHRVASFEDDPILVDLSDLKSCQQQDFVDCQQH